MQICILCFKILWIYLDVLTNFGTFLPNLDYSNKVSTVFNYFLHKMCRVSMFNNCMLFIIAIGLSHVTNKNKQEKKKHTFLAAAFFHFLS